MKLDVLRKVVRERDLPTLGSRYRDTGNAVVLCHGCFDIVHPGHIRYLQFARRQGDILVVSLTGDDAIEKSDGTRPYIPQELRAESLASLEFVDHVVIADDPTAEPIIRDLSPHVYIKGKEYEHSTDPRFIAEKKLVQSLGGRVIYSSGEVVFSSSTLIESIGETLSADRIGETRRLAACCSRWQIDADDLRRTISGRFVGKRIAVVGDALLDRYTFCDGSDVAGEAPILTVKPQEEATYLGGAAIVAAHIKALGGTPHIITTVAKDADSTQLINRLDDLNIEHSTFAIRQDLPTKLRYLVETQKLLKVDRAKPQPLDSSTQRQVISVLNDLKNDLDAVVFVDFGYGAVTITLLNEALPLLRPSVNTITGDVSGSRRSLLAMNEVDLLTPTERELRAALGDFETSLPAVAGRLMGKQRVANLAVTMGRRGCVMFRPREDEKERWFTGRLRSEYMPALSKHPVDPLGAGDAFLSAATLMLTTGATLPQTGYLASAVSAITIDRLGNLPVHRNELIPWITSRPELAPSLQIDAG